MVYTGGMRFLRPCGLTRLLPFLLVASAVVPQTPAPGGTPAPPEAEVPLFVPGDRLEIVERSNYSVRRDGRYAGHLQRETRVSLFASDGPGGQSVPREYRGEVYITENAIRDLRTIASPLAVRAGTTMEYDGTRLLRRAGALVSQGLPTVPADGAERGWEAPGVVRLELDGDTIASLPVVVAYRPVGYEEYQGARVFRIEFGYSLRWPLSPVQLEEHPAAEFFSATDLPPETIRIAGNRQGVLLLPASGGLPVLHRTDLVEQIVRGGGGVEERRGFLLTWYRGPTAQPGLVERLQERNISDVDIERDAFDRVRLSIRNLQFIADQAELLPGETGRLDAVAELLQSAGEGTILVTGHTADIGSVESQVELSVARARRITEELISRGVPPGRLRYEGRGGSEPIGDNATDAGRAANRRVEITLLGE
jgi:OmpA-OmpF porin, OOP family